MKVMSESRLSRVAKITSVRLLLATIHQHTSRLNLDFEKVRLVMNRLFAAS